MIEFNGEISEKIQLEYLKRVNKSSSLLFLYAIILVAFFGIGGGLLLNALNEIWVEILICEIILVLVIIFINFTPKRIALRFKLCPHIIITNEDLSLELLSIGEPQRITKKLSKVKKVLDCSEMYYIVFSGIEGAWICQKSNMIQGTVKEFEEIFKDKIKIETAWRV